MEKFKFKKSLGQNFLKDGNVINKIIDSSHIDENSLVIEIGPGSGALTREIISLCGYALLYEADGRLEESLHKLLKDYHNYSLFIGDFLAADLKKDLLGYDNYDLYVVANLPYYITTPIIMKFIHENVFPKKMIVMVQEEVALRFSAHVGSRDYGSLTVIMNYYYDISKLFHVSRNCFLPKPNVDSAVICMDLKEHRLLVKDIVFFKKLVKDCFHLKRKNLRNNLRNYNLDIVQNVLDKYGYNLDVRAEQLSLEIFVDMANSLVR